MLSVVATVSEYKPEVVAAFCERSGDPEVLAEPVGLRSVPVQIARHRVEEDAQWLLLRLLNQLRVGIGTEGEPILTGRAPRPSGLAAMA